MTTLVSRFPDRITPGALPLLPQAISLHHDLLRPGAWLVFNWFSDGEEYYQSPPWRCATLADALELVPDGYDLDWSCPEEFAPICYRLNLEGNDK